MRQDKTKKIVANFFVKGEKPLCQLSANKTTEKAWIWSCCDNSEEKAAIEKFCARFVSVDEFKKFQTDFEKY